MMDPIARELEVLRKRHTAAHVETNAQQQMLVVPAVPTVPGWSKADVTVRVLIPVGYPHAHLDCFLTDSDLRLASGAEPANSSLQVVNGITYRWFSWHTSHWTPGRDGLDQFVRFCERRLRDTA